MKKTLVLIFAALVVAPFTVSAANAMSKKTEGQMLFAISQIWNDNCAENEKLEVTFHVLPERTNKTNKNGGLVFQTHITWKGDCKPLHPKLSQR